MALSKTPSNTDDWDNYQPGDFTPSYVPKIPTSGYTSQPTDYVPPAPSFDNAAPASYVPSVPSFSQASNLSQFGILGNGAASQSGQEWVSDSLDALGLGAGIGEYSNVIDGYWRYPGTMTLFNQSLPGWVLPVEEEVMAIADISHEVGILGFIGSTSVNGYDAFADFKQGTTEGLINGTKALRLSLNEDNIRDYIYILNLLDFLETIGYLFETDKLSEKNIAELCGNSIVFYADIFEKNIKHRQIRDPRFYESFVKLAKKIGGKNFQDTLITSNFYNIDSIFNLEAFYE